jgi:Ceramidase
MIDLYCERVGLGLWAEPLNTLSNLAYFAAAWAVWRASRASTNSAGGALAGLLAAIGTGSWFFHMLATPWARVLDEVPILLFQLAFLWLYGTRLMTWSSATTAALLLAFVAAVYTGRQLSGLLNGSVAYAPALLVGAGLAVYHYRAQPHERVLLPIAVALFAGALVFRTIDNAVCDAFPVGTHFVWHMLTAFALSLFARGLIANMTPRG